MILRGLKTVGTALFMAALLLPPLLSRSAFAQQTDVRQYDIYNGFTYFETPDLNLAERGYHLQVGRNMKTWYALGFDYSVVTGHNSLNTSVLKTSLQQELNAEIEYLKSIGELPPSYELIVPTDAFSQTFAFGPQFEYRHFKSVTLFARPSLGAIRQRVTPHPTDPFATQVVEQLVPSGSKIDWQGFLRLRRRIRLVCDKPFRSAHAKRPRLLAPFQRSVAERGLDGACFCRRDVPLWQKYRAARALIGGERRLLRRKLLYDAFQLMQMVDVVAAHRLDYVLKGHRAALWMRDRLRMLFRRDRADECQVPVPDCMKGCERFSRVIACVGFSPLLLIEGLDDMVVLAQRLPQPVGEDQLAIRQVADDFAWAPLARRRRLIHAHRAKIFQDGLNLSRGQGEDFQWLLVA